MEVPKKRRGRKPKNKDPETTTNNTVTDSTNSSPTTKETILLGNVSTPYVPAKKKRGRKKKCLINVESCTDNNFYNATTTASNFTVDGNVETSIQSNNSSNSKNVEEISFGSLIVRRRRCKEIDPAPILQQIRESGMCRIDLSKVKDYYLSDSEDNAHSENEQKKYRRKVLKDNEKEAQKRMTPMKLKEFSSKESSSNSSTTTTTTTKLITNNHKKPESVVPQQDSIRDKTLPPLLIPPKENYTADVLQCYNGIEQVYPKHTDIWCWWCCHPFDERPCFIPTKYDPRRNRYQIQGNFCSWNCAKAYLINDSTVVNTISVHYFTSMVKKITGKFGNIKIAPPRQSLKCFGGTLSIESFRQNFTHTQEHIVLHTNNFALDDNYKIKSFYF
jgi:hypothetical protein